MPVVMPVPAPIRQGATFDGLGLTTDLQRRVHLQTRPLHGQRGSFVMMGHGARRDKDHILRDIFADENLGQKTVLGKRHGPFKGKTGASRIMSRSAGVLIRKRDNTLEISVHKKATETELDILMGKLRAHAMAEEGTMVFLIVTGRERYLGHLSNIDMDKLKEELKQHVRRGTTGILLVDQFGTRGLHTRTMHSARFKRRFQRDKSLYKYF